MDDILSKSYSQPLGRGMLYPPPPYSYRDARMMIIMFEGSRTSIEPFLPAGVQLADMTPLCILGAHFYPASAFGPYHEAVTYVRVKFGGALYMYAPMMFASSEGAVAAGRELWGFAKKFAVMDQARLSDQVVFTAERPRSQRILTAAVTCDKLAKPAELEAVTHPTMSVRLIPSLRDPSNPAICELVATANQKRYRQSAFGTDELWSGRPSLSIDSNSEVDPWHEFRPLRLLGGWFGHADLELPAGQLLHDYKAQALRVPLEI